MTCAAQKKENDYGSLRGAFPPILGPGPRGGEKEVLVDRNGQKRKKLSSRRRGEKALFCREEAVEAILSERKGKGGAAGRVRVGRKREGKRYSIWRRGPSLTQGIPCRKKKGEENAHLLEGREKRGGSPLRPRGELERDSATCVLKHKAETDNLPGKKKGTSQGTLPI